jgi:quinol-cytochrome oxidoreductase complex cytochrome b subunit
MEMFTTTTNVTINPQVIDGNITDWYKMIGQANKHYTKMRVVGLPNGGVKVEFYSPWDIREPRPVPVIVEVVENKPWWKFWGSSNGL